MQPKIKKWVVGTIPGIIFVGLVGNALWDLIKSSTDGVLVFFVRITTLGIASLNDGIYKEIAKGLHEDSSVRLYTLFIAMLTGFITGFIFLLIRKSKSQNIANEDGSNGSFKKITNNKNFSVFAICYFSFATLFFCFALVKATYINNSVTYYNNLITIVRPDITENDFNLFNSRFTQIKNRGDYSLLMSELETILKSKNYFTPEKPSLL